MATWSTNVGKIALKWWHACRWAKRKGKLPVPDRQKTAGKPQARGSMSDRWVQGYAGEESHSSQAPEKEWSEVSFGPAERGWQSDHWWQLWWDGAGAAMDGMRVQKSISTVRCCPTKLQWTMEHTWDCGSLWWPCDTTAVSVGSPMTKINIHSS